MADCEREALLAVAAKEMNGMPLIVGISHPGTAATVELCRQASR
jgi:dihydrodipicolinate synthase/N-acetylneuraminate lyase